MTTKIEPAPKETPPAAASSPSRIGANEVLLPLESVGLGRRTRAKRVGGKAAMLGRLVREGFPVPRGWVLDSRHFTRHVEETLPRGHDLPTLLKLIGTRAAVDRAARARDRILGQPLPDAIRAALAMLWDDIALSAPWGVAVRSSATSEDGDDTSMAGLATTMLGVRGPEALEAAVRHVYASAFLPRTLTYLAHAGVRDVAMAVLIQEMVRAAAAGVLFTAPPPGLESEAWPATDRLVSATLGLGTPVVEGGAAVDHFRLARNGTVVASVIASKRTAVVIGAGGLVEERLDDARANAPSLSAGALRELSAIADRIEGLGGSYDVEFAIAQNTGRVEVLQARPITSGAHLHGGDNETVWSRANLGEALPGAATPLTWSIARGFSDRGFRAAFAALGCHVPRGAVLVGNVQSRFYLNLSQFMRIAAQVPGLTPRALLGLSGGASETAIRILEAQVSDVSKRGFFLRLPLTAPRLIAYEAGLAAQVAAFEQEALRSRRALEELDLSLLPDDALATTLRSANALLNRTGVLMLTSASLALAHHLALSKLLERLASRRASARGREPDEPISAAPTDATHLAQRLTSGVQEVESAEPGIALSRVADIARQDEPARAALFAGRCHALADVPEGPTRGALDAFLRAHGYRAVRDAELATPRWTEDPSMVFAMLVAAMRTPAGEAGRALARARSLADRELATLETRLGTLELTLLRGLIDRAQWATRLRERLRTWVTRVLGMLRWIALDVDRRLRRIDATLEPGSVFFCTFDELIAALASGRAEVGHVVRLRRAEFARDAARPDPPPTFVGRPPPVVLPPASGVRVTGLPASGGVVEGVARVLEPGTTALDSVQPGEILIARTTDVGLSPLFLVAAAVVTELGGPLSHAAIIAREYGIPAVVNAAGATSAIRTGDRLRVDGDRGVIEKLGAPSRPPQA